VAKVSRTKRVCQKWESGRAEKDVATRAEEGLDIRGEHRRGERGGRIENNTCKGIARIPGIAESRSRRQNGKMQGAQSKE
jgi:hypothetical protein